MFNTDLTMKVGSTIGNIADNSSEILGFLDDIVYDTDFDVDIRNEISKEINAIEQSLINITKLLSNELQ